MGRGTAGTFSKMHIAGVGFVVVVKSSSNRIALCRCAHPHPSSQRSLGWGDPCNAAAALLPGVSSNYLRTDRVCMYGCWGERGAWRGPGKGKQRGVGRCTSDHCASKCTYIVPGSSSGLRMLALTCFDLLSRAWRCCSSFQSSTLPALSRSRSQFTFPLLYIRVSALRPELLQATMLAMPPSE
jgi:hypothetical protein